MKKTSFCSSMKKNFLIKTIEYNNHQITFSQLLETFFYLIENLKVSLETVTKFMENKNKIRGEFKKKLIMEYLLIPPVSPFALECFLGVNNIFAGIKIIEDKTRFA